MTYGFIDLGKKDFPCNHVFCWQQKTLPLHPCFLIKDLAWREQKNSLGVKKNNFNPDLKQNKYPMMIIIIMIIVFFTPSEFFFTPS